MLHVPLRKEVEQMDHFQDQMFSLNFSLLSHFYNKVNEFPSEDPLLSTRLL